MPQRLRLWFLDADFAIAALERDALALPANEGLLGRPRLAEDHAGDLGFTGRKTFIQALGSMMASVGKLSGMRSGVIRKLFGEQVYLNISHHKVERCTLRIVFFRRRPDLHGDRSAVVVPLREVLDSFWCQQPITGREGNPPSGEPS